MKKKIFLVFSAMLVFGLAIVVYSSVTATNLSTNAASCCCHGDSCPMKKKDASGKETASCGDNCDCCKGDSCPMKKKDASGKESSCCDGCDCCKGDSKATPKTVAYYFKSQPIYTTTKSSCDCCGANKDHKS